MRLLRALFFLLVLANLWLFARGQGYFGAIDEGREPKRLASQLSPEKLRVVSAVAPSAVPAAQACRLISGLSQEEALSLTTQAREKASGLELAVKPIEEPPVGRVQVLARGSAEALAKQLPGLVSAFPAASIADCPTGP